MRNTRRVGTGASMERLSALIEQRLAGGDKEVIDKKIWDLFGETWCVMFTDLAGFSRSVEQFGIIHFLQTVFASERELVPMIDEHDGIVLKTEGDSLLVVFRNPRKGVECAVAMQRHLRAHNAATAAEEDILLCVGLGYGRVLKVGDDDVFGAQVNAAAKLGEDTANAWEILITGATKDAVGELDGVSFQELEQAPPGAESAWRVVYES
jgi:adenylate cyclase